MSRTDHFQKRAAQRGITELGIQFVEQFGSVTKAFSNRSSIRIDKAMKNQLLNELKQLTRFVENFGDLHVIEDAKGRKITVYKAKRKSK